MTYSDTITMTTAEESVVHLVEKTTARPDRPHMYACGLVHGARGSSDAGGNLIVWGSVHADEITCADCQAALGADRAEPWSDLEAPDVVDGDGDADGDGADTIVVRRASAEELRYPNGDFPWRIVAADHAYMCKNKRRAIHRAHGLYPGAAIQIVDDQEAALR